MASQKEVELFDTLLDKGFDANRAKGIILKAREKGAFKEEEPTKTVGTDTGVTDKEEISTTDGGMLENKLSDAVTNFGKTVVEEAKGKTTQVTGKEIPFTEESKLAENFIPSAEKAFGEVLQTVGSPIESGINFLSTIKAILAKGAETSPVFGKLIQSSEGDKLIQEALTEGAQQIKTKVGEQGVIPSLNEAVQEDPALALTIMSSLFKKLGRAGGLSERDLNKIDALKEDANSKIESALNPTKSVTKQQVSQINPEIQERLKSGEITPADRKTIKSFTDEKVENIGSEIGKFIEQGKVKGEIDFDGMIDVLAKEDAKLRVDGNIIPGNEASAKFINAQLNFLSQLEKSYGKNLPPAKQLELRQKYDAVFDKTVTRDKITKFQDDLQVKLADSLRAELAKNNPDLDALNKDFSFYKTFQNVLDETIERKVGQDPLGLLGTIQTGVGSGVGAGIGSAFGPLGSTLGAITGGAIGLKLTRVLASPKYKLASAKNKLKLADAIAEKNPGKVEKILDSIIIAQGMDAEQQSREKPKKGSALDVLFKPRP